MPWSALLRPKTEILAVTNNLCLELKCSKRKNRAAAKINFATAPFLVSNRRYTNSPKISQHRFCVPPSSVSAAPSQHHFLRYSCHRQLLFFNSLRDAPPTGEALLNPPVGGTFPLGKPFYSASCGNTSVALNKSPSTSSSRAPCCSSIMLWAMLSPKPLPS